MGLLKCGKFLRGQTDLPESLADLVVADIPRLDLRIHPVRVRDFRVELAVEQFRRVQNRPRIRVQSIRYATTSIRFCWTR